MMETAPKTTRRSFLRKAFAVPALAVPAALAIRVLTPQQRLEAAMVEVERALSDLYPGTHVKRQFAAHKARGVVVIGALHDPDVRIRYYFDDGAPLLAEDARNTNRG